MELADNLGLVMLIAIIAMAISMAIIPIMMRFAPALGMIDEPGARKVHTINIPRIGGVGIVVGLIVPLSIWLPFDNFVTGVIFGSLVLLIFGAWDDVKNLGPYIKLFGQVISAIVVVYYGDIYIHRFPFMGLAEIPAYIGQPLTVFVIVGVINALNLSDGLDGLAGGEALLSLIAIAYMSFQVDGIIPLMIAAATIGGIFGFLRFNSHPARVFMGDSGSQTLGFILAVLVIYLTQDVNSVVSPALPALLIGLPVLDALVVFYLRARRGDSLVVAAKDHLHHRLLGIGFYHYESVIIIYSVQVLFVLSAVLMPYESDVLIVCVYSLVGVVLFGVITVCEARSLKVHMPSNNGRVFFSNILSKYELLNVLPQRILESGISLFLVASALMIETVPIDFGVSSAVMLCLLVPVVMTGLFGIALYRLIVFITVGFSVYMLSTYSPAWLLEEIHLVYLFFILLAATAFISVRLAEVDQFRITPLDYLVIAIAIIIGVMSGTDAGSSVIVWMGIQMIILFYLAELLIQRMKSMYNRLTGVLIVTLLLFATRALL